MEHVLFISIWTKLENIVQRIDISSDTAFI